MTRNYWLDAVTEQSWEDLLEAGGEASGFLQHCWEAVELIRPGDYILCHLAGIPQFIGVLEVTGEAFEGSGSTGSAAESCARVPVQVVHALHPESGVPVVDLRDELSIAIDLRDPNLWGGTSRGSAVALSREVGELLLTAIRETVANPILQPPDETTFAGQPQATATREVPVAVPQAQVGLGDWGSSHGEPGSAAAPTRTHMQGTLLELGTDLGLRVWVARSDRGRVWKGTALGDLPGCLGEVPRQFDEATSRAIELLDVLWLHNSAVVTAFEVVGSTSIYSSLLRMADLVAMQPNAKIPLYVVGPEGRRAKVLEQLNRPTFSRLPTPLIDVCRYIAFSRLQELLRCMGPHETLEAQLLAGAVADL